MASRVMQRQQSASGENRGETVSGHPEELSRLGQAWSASASKSIE